MSIRGNSPAIYAALRERFCAPEWALFFEVANGTGSNIRRYADAVAMNLFPSRGLTLDGFEVKISRSDWQRELKNPRKVEDGVFKYCDHWWVVAPAGLIDKAALPPTWGLLELLEKGSLRQAVAAPRLNPVELSRNFIAALLRRASEADEGVVERLVRKRVEDRTAGVEKEIERRVADRMRLAEIKLKTVEDIEAQLGMKLTDWSAHDGYGRLMRAIDATGISKSWGGLRTLAQTLGAMSQTLETHIAEFDAIAPELKKSEAA